MYRCIILVHLIYFTKFSRPLSVLMVVPRSVVGRVACRVVLSLRTTWLVARLYGLLQVMALFG